MSTRARLTLAQFLELPDTKPASEFADGEVTQKPMPNYAHMRLQMFFCGLLFIYLRQAPLGVAGPELRCIFGPPGQERAYVPDVVFFSHERAPGGDTRQYRSIHVAPDLAIEVLSPEQSRREFEEKLRFYLAHGVRLVWVIDPGTETVRVLAPGQPERTLTTADVLDGADVLPGFQVTVQEVMAQLVV
jgi:Uma2 family endonuclease